jgi:hypothetical protein
MHAVLELADELYKRGRSSGEAVDYSAFEEQVAHVAAAVERGVHHVALSGLDVDAPYIRVWGKCYRRLHRIARTYGSMPGPSRWSARSIGSSASVKAQRSIPSPCAPASWTGAGCRGLLAPWPTSFPK